MMELKLRADHFKGVNFGSLTDGPISRAVRTRYPEADVMEGVFSTYINGKVYWHEPYTIDEFDKDKKVASDFWYLRIFGVRRIKLDENDKGRMDQYLQSGNDTD